jgi:hypothetical protein
MITTSATTTMMMDKEEEKAIHIIVTEALGDTTHAYMMVKFEIIEHKFILLKITRFILQYGIFNYCFSYHLLYE